MWTELLWCFWPLVLRMAGCVCVCSSLTGGYSVKRGPSETVGVGVVMLASPLCSMVNPFELVCSS